MSNEKLLINDSKSNNSEDMSNKQIELLEKQLAFWKHHATELSKALTNEEEISNRYAEMLDKTEEELNAERVKTEWVSVAERLPEPNEKCLIAAKWGDRVVIDLGELVPSFDIITKEESYDWLITYDWDEGEGFEITHWMPLPEPPKMKQN